MQCYSESSQTRGLPRKSRTPVLLYNASPRGTAALLVVDVPVAGQDLALELVGVAVPQLGGLAVQRRRAGIVSGCYPRERAAGGSYLLGSPSRLCRLRRTVWMLYAAVHLSLRMSRQMRPEKSTLGW